MPQMESMPLFLPHDSGEIPPIARPTKTLTEDVGKALEQAAEASEYENELQRRQRDAVKIAKKILKEKQDTPQESPTDETEEHLVTIDEDDDVSAPEIDRLMLDKIKQATPEEISDALNLAEVKHARTTEIIVKARMLGLEFNPQSIELFVDEALGAIGVRKLLEKWSGLGEGKPTFEEYAQEAIDDDSDDSGGDNFELANYILEGYLDDAILDLYEARDRGASIEKPDPNYGYASQNFNKIVDDFLNSGEY